MSGRRTGQRWLPLLSVACLAAWLAAACFSERGAGPLAAGGACRVPVSVVDSQQVLVAIANFLFAPDSVRVAAGTTVTWVNCEDPLTEPHTTTSATGIWDSSEFPSGQRYSHTFNTPGVFGYFCSSHPFMVGKVVVQ